MSIAELLPALRRIGSGHRRLLAVILAGVLVIALSAAAVLANPKAVTNAQERTESVAAQALERTLVAYYSDALERLKPVGAQLVDDATAWATSASPLLTKIDASGLQSTADAVSSLFGEAVPRGASSAELKEIFGLQSRMVSGARERLVAFAASAAALAAAHLAAAPIADSGSRQAVVNAMAALDAALKSHAPVAAPFAALTASVAAVDAAQAAAVAAAQAAAAAAAAAKAARRGGGGGGGGGGGAPAARPGSPAASGAPAPVCSSDVLTCVNQIRAYYGFGRLSSNGTLNTDSQACAVRMATANSMTHSPAVVPPGFHRWGENIAHGYGSQVSVFNAWMNSPGHRANILNPSYTAMGLGYVSSGNWWCQQFGG